MNLSALVPDELSALPKDPYTNRSFIYARWENEDFARAQAVLDVPFSPDSSTPPGSRMLYSFGAAGRNAPESSSKSMNGTPKGPIGFLIPGAVDAVKGGNNVKADESSKNRPAPRSPSKSSESARATTPALPAAPSPRCRSRPFVPLQRGS